MKRILITVIILAAVILGVVGFLYRQGHNTPPPLVGGPAPLPKAEPASLGVQIFEKTENPTKDQFPETNPFTADTNPFDAGTNPYKDTYKNPF